jgi:bis(5'-nucleosyl)-tetraphosphatase (symmetrical)
MALYAIGDVQGCYDSLRRLLDKIRFDPASDQLWFTGDLVNGGPRSADVLRFVAGLGDRAVSVLGNHDLHLLAVAAGAYPLRSSDTFSDVLEASDRDELLTWLMRLPLLHHDREANIFLVHAGVLPQWDTTAAEACAHQAEAVISSGAGAFYAQMYGDKPDRWSDDLSGWDRVRFIVNAFTRLRFCYPDGRVDYAHKGPPGSQPAPLIPWFSVPQRQTRGKQIVFGHWSLLGKHADDNGVLGLDTGCLWGRELTAIRLAGGVREFFSVGCQPGC